MEFKELDRNKAQEEFEKIKENGIPENWYDKLNLEYKKIREDILDLLPEKGVKNDYDFDLNFGIKIYDYFNNILEFNEGIASNYGFWRYICIKVVPDIIFERHGFNAEYFYGKNVRLYIPTLWWYIHISYQGDLNKTYNCLKGFSTDYILNFVERPGRDGMYIDVARTIFKYLSYLPQKILNKKNGNQTLIRRLLIQNTAKSQYYNPVVGNSVEEYVKGLFKACGVEVGAYARFDE